MVTPARLSHLRCRPMPDALLAAWHRRSPWLASLLCTPALTTPLLEARLGCRLSSQKLLLPAGDTLLRLTLLATPSGECIERAEVSLPATSPWSSVQGPLGPLLASAGFQISKHSICPLAPLDDPAWTDLFPDIPCELIVGRSYQISAHPEPHLDSPPLGPWPVVEWWNASALLGPDTSIGAGDITRKIMTKNRARPAHNA